MAVFLRGEFHERLDSHSLISDEYSEELYKPFYTALLKARRVLLRVLLYLRVQISVVDVLVVEVNHPSGDISGQVYFLSPAQRHIFPGQQLL